MSSQMVRAKKTSRTQARAQSRSISDASTYTEHSNQHITPTEIPICSKLDKLLSSRVYKEPKTAPRYPNVHTSEDDTTEPSNSAHERLMGIWRKHDRKPSRATPGKQSQMQRRSITH